MIETRRLKKCWDFYPVLCCQEKLYQTSEFAQGRNGPVETSEITETTEIAEKAVKQRSCITNH